MTVKKLPETIRNPVDYLQPGFLKKVAIVIN